MNAQLLASGSVSGMRFPRVTSVPSLAIPIQIEIPSYSHRGIIAIPVGRLALFALLSVADLLLTWVLLRHTDGMVYESNPIANALLTQYGWAGMVIFKFTDVLLVASIALLLCYFQPRAARRVLSMACGIVGSVTLYSVYLVVQFV
jgi:hypothetical protein